MYERLDQVSIGSQFVRADLHIHSYGLSDGSYDVTDINMTPEAIVDISIQKNLKIISITDHNEINNSKKAIDYAKDKGILVIPGIEVSTTQGHLLLYFEDFSKLRNFYGKLDISEDKQRCSQGIVECLNLAQTYDGIGILAHIELTSGFEQTVSRFGPAMEDIVKHRNVWGLEISSKSSIDLYTERDQSPESAERKRLLNLRKQNLELGNDFEFAKLMSSDSHVLSKIGINAENNTRLTRIKVDSLNFQSFKVALINHQARIRLEDFIPERVPRFIGVILEGGLLSNQVIKFSPNLTCIIGGRGTGKSTLLESIIEASGNESTAKVLDSDVWPEKISLFYEDEAGQNIVLVREKNSIVSNQTDSNGITKIYIESYGQGETADTIQHSDENPSALLKFLDSFTEVDSLRLEDDEIRNILIDNQSELNKLRSEVSNIPDVEKQKNNLQNKLNQLEKEDVGELVKLQAALHKERSLRKSLIDDLKNLIDRYKKLFDSKDVLKSIDELNDGDIIVGKENFAEVKRIINEFAAIVENVSEKLHSELNDKIQTLRDQLTSWDSKEKEIQESIDKKRKELEEKGIPFDLGKINKIAQDLIYFKDRLKHLYNKDRELKDKIRYRSDMIKKRKEVKSKIYYKRLGFANQINENLKNTLDGLFVTVKFEEGKYSPQFEEVLKTTMDYRTAQVPKAKIISDTIDPISFVDSIKRRKLEILKSITDVDKNRLFYDNEIRKIEHKFNESFNYEDVECVMFEDRPKILVTKVFKNEEKESHVTKPLSQLSLGQQQSILLAILLHSKNKSPLVIDQPEDNLDSEFIFKSIVKNLRTIKERRQVIIVTHNPNIAVLGDAELILPLKSTNVLSHVMDRGSIDNPETQRLSCEILEGGRQAFIQRKMIYGI